MSTSDWPPPPDLSVTLKIFEKCKNANQNDYINKNHNETVKEYCKRK